MPHETIDLLKSSAKAIGRELEALGYPPVQHTHLLHVLSKAAGFETWNALRTAATAHQAPAAPSAARPYSKVWVAATYNANGRSVDVVRWEDPVVGLGDAFYVYDAETFQCLTPTAEYVFADVREVPDYEAIVTLLDQLEQLHCCATCGHLVDASAEAAVPERCTKPGCTGVLRPFLIDGLR